MKIHRFRLCPSSSMPRCSGRCGLSAKSGWGAPRANKSRRWCGCQGVCVRCPDGTGRGGGALRDPETRAEVGESEQAANFFRIVLALGRLFQRQSKCLRPNGLPTLEAHPGVLIKEPRQSPEGTSTINGVPPIAVPSHEANSTVAIAVFAQRARPWVKADDPNTTSDSASRDNNHGT